MCSRPVHSAIASNRDAWALSGRIDDIKENDNLDENVLGSSFSSCSLSIHD